jgi:formylglycine-generating enzyme required for sulfatase activity
MLRTTPKNTRWPHLHMMHVPGGTFEMGSASENAYDDEKPVHTVTVSDFELAQFPVTQALWEAVMGEGSNPSHFEGPRRPVDQVSWYDAVAFCNRLNHFEKLPFCYFSDEQCSQPYALEGELPNKGPVYYKPALGTFRLPTEAEWEYAARGGPLDTKTDYAGSGRVKDAAWHSDNSGGETHPVGLLQPNALVLYDMSGNVFEWCWDWKDNYSPEAQTNPVGPWEGEFRVVRGGALLFSDVRNLRVSDRIDFNPDTRIDFGIGFRLARHLNL